MSLKHKLLAKNRKIAKTIQIDGADVQIRKPTFGDRLKVFESARAAKDLDEKNEATSERAATRMVARIAACVLFDPATGQRIFADNDLDEMLEESWLEDHLEDFQAVFHLKGETARGNSNATPS